MPSEEMLACSMSQRPHEPGSSGFQRSVGLERNCLYERKRSAGSKKGCSAANHVYFVSGTLMPTKRKKSNRIDFNNIGYYLFGLVAGNQRKVWGVSSSLPLRLFLPETSLCQTSYVSLLRRVSRLRPVKPVVKAWAAAPAKPTLTPCAFSHLGRSAIG